MRREKEVKKELGKKEKFKHLQNNFFIEKIKNEGIIVLFN
jgi:hypothetical protein